MDKRKLIQIFLILIMILTSYLIFILYFDKKDEKISKLIREKEANIESEKIKSSNLIEDLKYISSDKNGNQYEIKSKSGEIDLNNPNIIFMKNVNAKIYQNNLEEIIIKSNYAKYNSLTYETFFSDNVRIFFENHHIKGDNLNISFADNLATLYKNIIYNGPEMNINADRLEMNILTKETQIFMDDEDKKIKVTSKNK